MTWPVVNAEWWRAKIERNRARDRDTDRRLFEAGWTVVRVWEHEDPVFAAARVEAVLSSPHPAGAGRWPQRDSEGD